MFFLLTTFFLESDILCLWTSATLKVLLVTCCRTEQKVNEENLKDGKQKIEDENKKRDWKDKSATGALVRRKKHD